MACDGKLLQAHKIVLAICSPYFQEMFITVQCRHPISKFFLSLQVLPFLAPAIQNFHIADFFRRLFYCNFYAMLSLDAISRYRITIIYLQNYMYKDDTILSSILYQNRCEKISLKFISFRILN